MCSDFWYEKQQVPEFICSQLRNEVKGTVAGVLPNGVRLLTVSPVCFKRSFDVNRIYLYRGDFTAPSYENDYFNAVNYLTENGLAGFSVSNDGWLSSLFSNQTWKGFARMIIPYIKV